MSPAFFTLITALVLAGTSDDVLNQQKVVEQAASDVANARAEGARSRKISQLMARYRSEAEQLIQLQKESGNTPPMDKDPAHQAQILLRDALANGQSAPEARAQLAKDADPLKDRLEQYQGYKKNAIAQENLGWKKATYHDLADALRVLILVANYDAAQLQLQAQSLSIRARSLEMGGNSPGMGQNLNTDGESRRLIDESNGLRATAQDILQHRDQADTLLQSIYTELETIQ